MRRADLLARLWAGGDRLRLTRCRQLVGIGVEVSSTLTTDASVAGDETGVSDVGATVGAAGVASSGVGDADAETDGMDEGAGAELSVSAGIIGLADGEDDALLDADAEAETDAEALALGDASGLFVVAGFCVFETCAGTLRRTDGNS